MKHGLFRELKRRHVYRVAIAYAVVGWLVIQAAATVSPYLHLPDTLTTMVIVVVALGFPVAVILAWAFEVTPEGVRRTEPADSPQARASELHRKVGRKLDFIIIGVLALALVLSLWRPWVYTKHPVIVAGTSSGHAAVPASTTPAKAAAANPTATEAKAIPAKSIAVLPFENLSSDKNNQYFADGMQDLILTKLADIGDLAVISRTSTMQYGSHPENLQAVGKQLGVATILEGSVQRVGDQVLVNVQLIDARNDHHIWAKSFRRTLKDVFSVEGEVASKIAATLKAKLSPAETQRLATTLSGNAEANDLYLRGEYFSHRGVINYDTAAMKQAIAFYQQAIAKAPDFAQARAMLSFMESALAWFGGGGENAATLYADAVSQAEQALKLAPELADAHLALGYYYYFGKGDYAAALKAFAAALALRPNDTSAMLAKAFVLRRQGKFNEAIGVFQKALVLDPRNTVLAAEMAGTYLATSQYAQAEQVYQRALALDPANVNARSFLPVTIVYRSGNLSKALAQAQGDNPRLALARVGLLTWARKYDQALTLLQSIRYSSNAFIPINRGTKSMQLAYLYELRGEPAKARAYYARALPQARAHYAAMAGSPVINQALVLIQVAQAELGLGQTKAGLMATAKVMAIAEQSSDHLYTPLLMERCAERYAQAGRAGKAVRVLSKALVTQGIGTWYSPVMLWIDPVWDPIRKDPRFQALLTQYAKYKPAPASGEAGHD